MDDEGVPHQRKSHKKRKRGVFFKRGGSRRTHNLKNIA